MKKSLVALAVMGAFSGAAFAQSSVTVYGIIDLGVAKINDGTTALVPGPAGNAVGDAWSMKTSTSSRLGFRGTEDLGNGLKANFLIEHRFTPDNGNLEAGRFWQGSSWVGLSSGMGELRLGRDYIPAFYTALAGDPWGYDYNVAGFAGFSRAGNSAAGGDDAARGSNQISYKTPNFGGLTAMVSVAAGEGAAPNGRGVGANVVYSAGPLYVSAAYHDVQRTDNLDNRFMVATVAYDLGFVRPSLLIARSDNVAGTAPALVQREADSWILGATAPLGNGVLKAGYGVSDNGAAAGTAGREVKKFGLGYQYNLSKRTSVHADVGSAKGDGQTRTQGIEAGIKHVF